MSISPSLPPVITVDGPGGSGKGTISLLLARELGWHFLDSGALYRALACYLRRKGILPHEELEIAMLAQHLPVVFDEFQILLSGEDISSELRWESTGQLASVIAAYPAVRTALLERQRAFLRAPGLVADGRDMGTVVFPAAFLKLYLEASLEERAKRRYLQLKASQKNGSLDQVLHEIKVRDQRDKSRASAPLRPATDALVLDTTGLSISAVFEQVMQLVKQKQRLG